MKFTFLKFKKNSLPPLGSLRPPIFDSKAAWFYSLAACFLIFIITALIGFKIFYSQYFESYKKADTPKNYDNLVDISALKTAVERRGEFMNKELSVPKDPSL